MSINAILPSSLIVDSIGRAVPSRAVFKPRCASLLRLAGSVPVFRALTPPEINSPCPVRSKGVCALPHLCLQCLKQLLLQI